MLCRLAAALRIRRCVVLTLLLRLYIRTREALNCYTARLDLTLSILSRSVSMCKYSSACEEVKLSVDATNPFVCNGDDCSSELGVFYINNDDDDDDGEDGEDGLTCKDEGDDIT